MNSSDQNSPLWRHGTFQKLFWAHVISLVGSGLSSVALALLAHQLVGASASAVLGIILRHHPDHAAKPAILLHLPA